MPSRRIGARRRARAAATQVAHHREELELGAGGHDRARSREGLEVGVAQLERHRARLDAALARAPAHPLAERSEPRLDDRRVAGVAAERALVGEAAGGVALDVVLLERRAVLADVGRPDAERAVAHALGPGAEHRAQDLDRSRRDLAERASARACRAWPRPPGRCPGAAAPAAAPAPPPPARPAPAALPPASPARSPPSPSSGRWRSRRSRAGRAPP